MKNLLIKIIDILTSTPFYPHWLNNLKARKIENELFSSFKGLVLEVGAGEPGKRDRIRKMSPKIKKYIVSDYSSWDEEFGRVEKTSGIANYFQSLFLGFKKRGELDIICDATDLPFKNNSFNYHLGFEVLEHISDPFKYISEASRVLKRGGEAIISVPVFYRVHGLNENHDFDYFRYMPGFFHSIAPRYGFVVQRIYFNTGVGTTFAQMFNQYIIENIKSSNHAIKFVLLILSILIFPITNLFGFIIDLRPDIRFSNRYFVVLKKQVDNENPISSSI